MRAPWLTANKDTPVILSEGKLLDVDEKTPHPSLPLAAFKGLEWTQLGEVQALRRRLQYVLRTKVLLTADESSTDALHSAYEECFKGLIQTNPKKYIVVLAIGAWLDGTITFTPPLTETFIALILTASIDIKNWIEALDLWIKIQNLEVDEENSFITKAKEDIQAASDIQEIDRPKVFKDWLSSEAHRLKLANKHLSWAFDTLSEISSRCF